MRACGGYAGAVHYTHSSTLRTLQEIFGVTPFLADAANATDLSDLFLAPGEPLPISLGSAARLAGGGFEFSVYGVTPGSTNFSRGVRISSPRTMKMFEPSPSQRLPLTSSSTAQASGSMLCTS